MADAALGGGHVLRHPLAVSVGIRFLEILFEKFEDSVEAEAFFFLGFGFFGNGIFGAGAAGGWIAVQEQILYFLRKFIERGVEIEAVGIGC